MTCPASEQSPTRAETPSAQPNTSIDPRAGTADVSIIVRTKDRPEILRRALASILGQSFSDWEAVIVNDGGDPAAIYRVLKEVESLSAGRFSVVNHATPRGRWGAANAGLSATDAPLVVLHDDDDSWHPEFLSHTAAYLRSHPEADAVLARTEVILEEPGADGFVETGRYRLEDHNTEVLLTDLLDFNRFVPISFLYRRALHDRIGLYDASLPAAGDWAFNLAAVALRPIAYVSDVPLAYWHQRPAVRGAEGNSVHANQDEHRFADRAFRDKQLRTFVQSAGLGLPLLLSAAARREEEAAREREQVVLNRLDEVVRSLDAVHERMQKLEHDLSRTIDTRVRGWAWRQKQRFRRRS